MEHYKIIGEYQDPSAKNGIVKVDFAITLVNGIALTANSEKRVLGYFMPITDPKLQERYGLSQIQMIELSKKHSSRLESNILWRAYCQGPFTEGEFRGERIESLDKIRFDNTYEIFDKAFADAAKRGTEFLLNFTFFKI